MDHKQAVMARECGPPRYGLLISNKIVIARFLRAIHFLLVAKLGRPDPTGRAMTITFEG
jgi:hypothetical protein